MRLEGTGTEWERRVQRPRTGRGTPLGALFGLETGDAAPGGSTGAEEPQFSQATPVAPALSLLDLEVRGDAAVAAVREELEQILRVREGVLAELPANLGTLCEPEELAEAFLRDLYDEWSDEQRPVPLPGASFGMPRARAERVAAGSLDVEPLIAQMRENRVFLRYLVGRLPTKLPPHVDDDDVLQEASLAVLFAFRKYRPDLPTGLTAHVRTTVRSWILDWQRSLDTVSHWRSDQIKALREVEDRLVQQLWRVPSDAELAAETGWQVDVVRRVFEAAAARDLMSWQTVVDREPLDPGGDPFELLSVQHTRRVLGEAVTRLPEEERNVVVLSYVASLTTREIAQRLGTTTEGVRWLHNRALRHLRAALSRGAAKAGQGKGPAGGPEDGRARGSADGRGQASSGTNRSRLLRPARLPMIVAVLMWLARVWG